MIIIPLWFFINKSTSKCDVRSFVGDDKSSSGGKGGGDGWVAAFIIAMMVEISEQWLTGGEWLWKNTTIVPFKNDENKTNSSKKRKFKNIWENVTHVGELVVENSFVNRLHKIDKMTDNECWRAMQHTTLNRNMKSSRLNKVELS